MDDFSLLVGLCDGDCCLSSKRECIKILCHMMSLISPMIINFSSPPNARCDCPPLALA